MSETPETESLRLDIWLWHARFFRTRSAARKAVAKGRMRLTRFGTVQRLSKPHFGVMVDDVLTLTRGDTVQTVQILALGTRRGPATEAQTLYSNPPL